MKAPNSLVPEALESRHAGTRRDEESSDLENHFQFYRVAGDCQTASGPMTASFMSVLTSASEQTKSRRWRRMLGIVLLLTAVLLWTVMGFTVSSILATDVYSNAYILSLMSSSFFVLPLIIILICHAHDTGYRRSGWQGILRKRTGAYRLLEDLEYESRKPLAYHLIGDEDRALGSEHLSEADLIGQNMLRDSMVMSTITLGADARKQRATVGETMKMAGELFAVWFFGVYTAAACLRYTTMASATILASTISVWTLIIGVSLRVERLTLRAFLAVTFSFLGVVLISSIDITASDDSELRGAFPSKTPREIAIGDLIALLGALLAGLYAVLMKARIPGEWAVNMPLLMSLMGLYSTVFLSPGILILHITGIEEFALPPSGKIVAILLLNSTASLVAEMCFAWANLLTSPVTVTVGVALGIPLAIVGEMVINGGSPSPLYWLGAAIVFFGFFLVGDSEPVT